MKLHLLQKDFSGNIHVSCFKGREFLKLWHYHPQHELVYIERGEGMLHLGDYIGAFKPGDIFYIGSHVPHMFNSTPNRQNTDDACKAYVIHIEEHFLAGLNMQMEEFDYIRVLLEESKRGIVFSGDEGSTIRQKMEQMLQSTVQVNAIYFLQALLQLYHIPRRQMLAGKVWLKHYNYADKRLNKVVQYIMQNFQKNMTLDEIADVSGMNSAAFCRYFKGHTQKSFIEYVNELRVQYACNLLINNPEEKPISEICFEAGFNSMSYFSRTFKMLTDHSPTSYREQIHAKAGEVVE